MSSPRVLYRRILKRVAKLEAIGVDVIHFRRPVSYRDVLSGPTLSTTGLYEQWEANLDKVLPWLAATGAAREGTIATDGLREVARRHFEGGLGGKGEKPSSSWLTRALDAYICLISQTRLAFCASVDSVPAAGGSLRVEAWSSGIDSPFSSPFGGDENHHFAYRVRLENATNKEIELVGRRLEVTNSEGKTEKLIPGYQPIHGGGGSLVGASINPGEVFEYASHTSLTTESGVCRCSFALRCFEEEDDDDNDDNDGVGGDLVENTSLGDVLPHTAGILAPEEPDKSDPTRGLPPSSSDTRTHGIRVKVASKYVPERSTPRLGKFFFTYKVKIENETSATVQVLDRHWNITDSEGRQNVVSGRGVVGEQPILRPGECFEYTSACPLQTSSILSLPSQHIGSMEGHYGLAVFKENDLDFNLEQASLMEIGIQKFGLNAVIAQAREQQGKDYLIHAEFNLLSSNQTL